jgi:hypothetical protein
MELYLRSATCFHGVVISSVPEKFTYSPLPMHGMNNSNVESLTEMRCCIAGGVTQTATGRYISQEMYARHRCKNLKSRNNNCNIVFC